MLFFEIGIDREPNFLKTGHKCHYMKRIVSLDFLRGLAILLMTIFHTWFNVFDTAQIDPENLLSMNPLLLLIGGPFMLLGHFRSFFLLLSATVHQFSIMKDYTEKKRTPRNILTKNVILGVLLYFIGLIREGLLNPWGILSKWFEGNGWAWSNMTYVYLFEAIQMIGVGLIFLGVINYCFMRFHWLEKLKRVNLVLAIIGIAIFIATPFVHQAINSYLGFELNAPGAFDNNLITTTDYFTRFFWGALGATESPIFPYLAQFCAGAMLGSFLAQPHPSRRNLSYIQLTAVGLMILGVIVWILFFDMELDFWFHIHPQWFFLISLGAQLLLITGILRANEFKASNTMVKYIKRTRFFRRWSIVALSVYMYQLLDLFPRMLLTALTDMNFTDRGKLDMGAALAAMLLVLVMFDVGIRLWEKVRFIGTWEWILVSLGRIFAGKKRVSTDRLHVQEVLYDVEPIRFIPHVPVKSLEILHSP
jgi:uncharacterized membrane protein